MGKVQSKPLLSLHACSNCWICEGWTEVRFEWDPILSPVQPHDPKTIPVYLHLSTDGYAPELILPEEGSTIYATVRMVPPG